jgi:DNA-binding NarL/FixJ family response regulator
MSGGSMPQGDPAPIRVMIVDDHGVVRRGLRTFLGVYPDVEVVGEADDGESAVAQIAVAERSGTAPDVVLMDLSMPRLDGVEVTRLIRSRWPHVEVVVVTSFVEEARVQAALDAGASGYVIKDAAAEEIVLAVRAAHRGELMLDPAVTKLLMARARTGGGRTTSPGPLECLTDREREVLALVARGLDNRSIARELVTSERTARTHVSNILRKLGLASRTQAALFAVEHGLEQRGEQG